MNVLGVVAAAPRGLCRAPTRPVAKKKDTHAARQCHCNQALLRLHRKRKLPCVCAPQPSNRRPQGATRSDRRRRLARPTGLFFQPMTNPRQKRVKQKDQTRQGTHAAATRRALAAGRSRAGLDGKSTPPALPHPPSRTPKKNVLQQNQDVASRCGSLHIPVRRRFTISENSVGASSFSSGIDLAAVRLARSLLDRPWRRLAVTQHEPAPTHAAPIFSMPLFSLVWRCLSRARKGASAVARARHDRRRAHGYRGPIFWRVDCRPSRRQSANPRSDILPPPRP